MVSTTATTDITDSSPICNKPTTDSDSSAISLDQSTQLIHTIFCGWSTASPKEKCMKMDRTYNRK